MTEDSSGESRKMPMSILCIPIICRQKMKEIVKASTEYSTHIHASVEQGNVFACQFHPEKSSDVGLHILKTSWNCKEERKNVYEENYPMS